MYVRCNGETIIRNAYIRAYWSIKWERRLRYTPQQLYCTVCTDRTFYLMAQDDGTLEAYCHKNNHKRELVNVPALAQEVYAAIEAEIAAAIGGGHSAVERAQDAEVQAQGETDNAVVQHGPLSDPHSTSDE